MQDEPELTEAGKWYRDRDEWCRHLMGRTYLTDAQKLVGIFIAMHMNRVDNHAKHQQTTIAKDLGIHVDTVKRAIKRLRDDDVALIDREQLQRGRRNRAVNRYRLIFPWS
ncbi:DNA-binding MarR family transcriptional regulator [Phyllobacterium ifriqiyense]|uniref:DNA-binding MarR family transcriptional regulator n=2 Tax=Phyllobacterium ifriqiyense TaxID=314238 RepID=A0ABU0S827_9HYPH|nr:DNA-binding MarR family transcriptional regulator [Phyllobacterium ifriqiyense]